jgi:hypothetical protein
MSLNQLAEVHEIIKTRPHFSSAMVAFSIDLGTAEAGTLDLLNEQLSA